MCKEPRGRLIFAAPVQPRTSPPLRSLMDASSARRLPAYLVPPPARARVWGPTPARPSDLPIGPARPRPTAHRAGEGEQCPAMPCAAQQSPRHTASFSALPAYPESPIIAHRNRPKAFENIGASPLRLARPDTAAVTARTSIFLASVLFADSHPRPLPAPAPSQPPDDGQNIRLLPA